jgi:hypothetical protein
MINPCMEKNGLPLRRGCAALIGGHGGIGYLRGLERRLEGLNQGCDLGHIATSAGKVLF